MNCDSKYIYIYIYINHPLGRTIIDMIFSELCLRELYTAEAA